MTDMAIGEKYAPLGNWLKEHGGDSVKLTFNELNQIIPIPNHAYKNRPSWANLSNPASFCSSWISAGYVVDSISLEEQWVVFRKGEVQGHTHHSKPPYALTADHHRVHALDAEKGQEYYCPVCGNQVIPRQGEVNSWHFAHVTSCVDDWKYDMSEWHRNWQNRFPESTREVVIEYKGESHRADILTGGYVIEFQHSPITSTEFERRNLFYTKAGYKVTYA